MRYNVFNYIQPYFKTIKQINTLSLTSTQLGFGRVIMHSAKLVDEEFGFFRKMI